jgi:hypothetical protein
MTALTDWHHLAGITLTDLFTGTFYDVTIEEDLSKKKQLLDILIIRRKRGKPPEELPDGFEDLADYNLVSYKSVHEAFDDWSADELVGHFVNFRKQTSPALNSLLPKDKFRLYAVCTRYPRKLAEHEKFEPVKEGIYDVRWGGRRKIRLIVTSRVAKEKRNAVWLMFSAAEDKVRYGVANYKGRLNEMSSTVSQMLAKYRAEGIIDMPYTLEDYRNEVKQNVLNSMTGDEILSELVKKASPEKILETFPLDELLKKASPEDLLNSLKLKGVSPEEIEAYLKKKKTRRKKS